MNKDDFVKALEKMRLYCELDNPEIIEHLQSEASKHSISKKMLNYIYRLQKGSFKTIDFEALDLYFSIYKAEANIAFSRQTDLITRIYFQLNNLRDLIDKWVQEQESEECHKIAMAKLLHFDSIVNLFHHIWFRRESFYFEDEIYFRICDAKKFLKMYVKDDASLNSAIKVLDDLEKATIDKCYEKRIIKKNDVIEKLENLKTVLAETKKMNKNLKDVDKLIKILKNKKDLFLSREIPEVIEDSGSLTNYSITLDKYFDKADLIEDFYSVIDTSDNDSFAYYDKIREKKGMKPIYFIFEKQKCYFKTFINGVCWQNKNSQERKSAIEEKIKKLEAYAVEQKLFYSSTNRILSNSEKKEKEIWEAICKDIKKWKTENKTIVRKTLNKGMNCFKRKTFERIDSDVY